jgi:hypothetical protein
MARNKIPPEIPPPPPPHAATPPRTPHLTIYPSKPPVWENTNHTHKIQTGEIPVAYPPPPLPPAGLYPGYQASHVPGTTQTCLPCQARPRDHGNPVFHASHAPGMGLFPALLTSKLDSLLTLHSQWLYSKPMRHHQSTPPPPPEPVVPASRNFLY